MILTNGSGLVTTPSFDEACLSRSRCRFGFRAARSGLDPGRTPTVPTACVDIFQHPTPASDSASSTRRKLSLRKGLKPSGRSACSARFISARAGLKVPGRKSATSSIVTLRRASSGLCSPSSSRASMRQGSGRIWSSRGLLLRNAGCRGGRPGPDPILGTHGDMPYGYNAFVGFLISHLSAQFQSFRPI